MRGCGEIGHINSQWQRAHGVPPVDVDTFVNDWQLRTGNRSLFPLIKTYAMHCGEAFDWLIAPLSQEEKDGIHPMLMPPSPHMPETLNGFHAWPGTPNMGMALQTRAVKASQQLAREHGAEIFFSTRALQLEQAENMRVTGVYGQERRRQHLSVPGGEGRDSGSGRLQQKCGYVPVSPCGSCRSDRGRQ